MDAAYDDNGNDKVTVQQQYTRVLQYLDFCSSNSASPPTHHLPLTPTPKKLNKYTKQ